MKGLQNRSQFVAQIVKKTENNARCFQIVANQNKNTDWSICVNIWRKNKKLEIGVMYQAIMLYLWTKFRFCLIRTTWFLFPSFFPFFVDGVRRKISCTTNYFLQIIKILKRHTCLCILHYFIFASCFLYFFCEKIIPPF